MDLKALQVAIKQIAAEKNISEESIAETLNQALAAAYRKDFGSKNQNIFFEFDPKSGDMRVYDKKVVVDFDKDIIAKIREQGADKKWVDELPPEWVNEDGTPKEGAPEQLRFDPKTDVLLEDAKIFKKKAAVGDEIITDLDIPSDFGRMAAQTAKQVIIQKIREAERELVFAEYRDKQDTLIVGTVQRREHNHAIIDLGKATAFMPFEEMVRGERYVPGDRMKFYVVSVGQSIKGPEIVVSRAHPNLIRRLFEAEIPEIAAAAIDIKGIAREAGSRTKVAVWTAQENIDPIGSCIGQRGSRIQTIIAELSGEKIDIIEYADDPAQYIQHALSPAKTMSIEINEAERAATVTVAEDQLSLAIGKEGQNVRLAVKLTGWKINIVKAEGGGAVEVPATPAEETPA